MVLHICTIYGLSELYGFYSGTYFFGNFLAGIILRLFVEVQIAFRRPEDCNQRIRIRHLLTLPTLRVQGNRLENT